MDAIGAFLITIPQGAAIKQFLMASTDQPAKPEALPSLHDVGRKLTEAVKLHEEADRNESILHHWLACLWDGGAAKSLEQLKQLDTRVKTGLDNRGDPARPKIASQLQREVEESIKNDQDAVSSRDTTLGYVEGGLQIGLMALTARFGCGSLRGLLIGTASRAPTAALSALDSAKWADPDRWLTDGAIGAAKGVTINETYLRTAHWNPFVQGAFSGTANRFLESATNRSNYANGITEGVWAATTQALDLSAMALDGGTFLLAGGAAGGINRLTGGRFLNNPYTRTAIAGGAFGFTSGVANELVRQNRNSSIESFNLGKAFESGAIQAGINSLAPLPATHLNFRLARANPVERARDGRLSLDDMTVAPESSKKAVFQALTQHVDPQTRFAIMDRFTELPNRDRAAVVADLLNTSDPRLYALALHHLGDVPAEERLPIWLKAHDDLSKLTVTDFEYRFNGDHHMITDPNLRDIAERTPTTGVLLATSALAAQDQTVAWNRAISVGKLATRSNFERLPPEIAFTGWKAAVQGEQYRLSENDLHALALKFNPAERLDATRYLVAEGKLTNGTTARDIIASLPLEDRYPAWVAMFERAKPSPDLNAGFGAQWHSLYRPVETPEKVFANAAAYSVTALPESVRSQAWLKVAASFPHEGMNGLINSLRSFPAESRFSMAQTLIGEPFLVPATKISELASALPGKRYEELFQAIMQIRDAQSRQALLRNLPVTNLIADRVPSLTVALEGQPESTANATTLNISRMPGQTGFPTIERMFKELTESGSESGREVLGHWWRSLDRVGGSDTRALRQHLLETVGTSALSPIVLETRADLAQRVAMQHPDIVAALLNERSGLSPAHKQAMEQILEQWLNQPEPGKLVEVLDKLPTRDIVEDHSNFWDVAVSLPDDVYNDSKDNVLLAQLIGRGTPAEKAAFMNALVGRAIDAPREHLKKCLAVARVAGETPESFFAKLDERLRDQSVPADQRFKQARRLGDYLRENEANRESSLYTIPDVRASKYADIPPEDVRLIENSLRHPRAFRQLLGTGLLGKYIPQIFGHYEANNAESGILGRPQHGGRTDLDVHIVDEVLPKVLKNPEFHKLSEYDQVNLLWAVIGHDIGKRANMIDKSHEWSSAAQMWGVLRSMGYQPSRMQRIISLIKNHSQMSVDGSPVQRLGNAAALDDMAARLPNPVAVRQARILNEADVQSLSESYWTDTNRDMLDTATEMVAARNRELQANLVPFVTTSLPMQYSLHLLPANEAYAFEAHHSNDWAQFVRQLASIESPDYAISSALITDKVRPLRQSGVSLFAIVGGPFENNSQMGNKNLFTSGNVNWQSHIALRNSWSKEGKRFADHVERLLLHAGIEPGQGETALQVMRRELSTYDSLDELVAAMGPSHALVRGHNAILYAMTHDYDGTEVTRNNEVKRNDGTLTGFGIRRGNRRVSFENMSDEDAAALLGSSSRPNWLAFEKPTQRDDGYLTVPEWVWRLAQRRGLPIVVLDP